MSRDSNNNNSDSDSDKHSPTEQEKSMPLSSVPLTPHSPPPLATGSSNIRRRRPGNLQDVTSHVDRLDCPEKSATSSNENTRTLSIKSVEETANNAALTPTAPEKYTHVLREADIASLEQNTQNPREQKQATSIIPHPPKQKNDTNEVGKMEKRRMALLDPIELDSRELINDEGDPSLMIPKPPSQRSPFIPSSPSGRHSSHSPLEQKARWERAKSIAGLRQSSSSTPTKPIKDETPVDFMTALEEERIKDERKQSSMSDVIGKYFVTPADPVADNNFDHSSVEVFAQSCECLPDTQHHHTCHFFQPKPHKPQDGFISIDSAVAKAHLFSQDLGTLVEQQKAGVFFIGRDDHKLISLDDLDDYLDDNDVKKIGRGNQGSIYPVVIILQQGDKREKYLCVVKELKKQSSASRLMHQSDESDDEAAPNVTRARRSSTPIENHYTITKGDRSSIKNNIINLMAILNKNDKQYALLPYCGLFLNNIISELNKKEQEPAFASFVILHVMLDLLHAMKSMHEKGFVHGDIKDENIGHHRGHFCFIDLDSALRIGERVVTPAGSPLFMHPKCFNDAQFCATPQNDIYALGIVLKRLLNDPETMAMTKNNLTLQEMSKTQSEKYSQAKKQRETSAQKPQLSLQDALQQCKSTHDKLLLLANRMTSILPQDQPSVDELLPSFKDIWSDFRAPLDTPAAKAIETELKRFYDALTPKDLLVDLDDVKTPIDTLSPLSLFKNSF